MKTKLLTAAIVCTLLLSITGCAADKAEQMLHDNVEITVNTDAVTEPSADTQAVALTAETAEKEMSGSNWRTATAFLCAAVRRTWQT